MGLDMNLYNKNNEEVMYWRKANQIRGWLVSHKIIEEDDNCTDRLVTVQNLKDLIEDCNKVLANHELAEEIMPTTSGFFFGGTGFDEWYFEELKDTVEKLQPIVDAAKEDDHFIYSDWW